MEEMGFWNKYRDYAQDNPKRLWFKRKLYGWGWTPVTWQGWLVVVAFIFILVWNYRRIEAAAASESEAMLQFLPQAILLILVLILISRLTGESPRWQWGFPKKEEEEEGEKIEEGQRTE